MSIERAILKRLLEYRTIKLRNGDSVYRHSSGIYYYKPADGDKKEISREEYVRYRNGNIDEYPYPNTHKITDPSIVRDIQDFNRHYDRIRKNIDTYGLHDEKGNRTLRQETLFAFEDAIRAMIDYELDYQSVKPYLSKKSIKLIDRTIDHENSNNTSI